MAEVLKDMSEGLHNLLQCFICLERLSHPRMLPCQHTFCLKCLRGIAKDDKTIACRQCRVKHQLPKEGVDALPDNMTIENLLTMVGENDAISSIPQAECFDCHKIGSLSECQHCKESVCTDCRVSHEKILAEIQLLLKLSENYSKETLDEISTILENLTKEIAAKKAEIPGKFTNLRREIEEKILERERNLSRYMETLQKRVVVTLSLSGEEKKLSTELKAELQGCKTTSALEMFRNLLELTEKGISAYLENSHFGIDVLYTGFDLNGCGNVHFRDYVVDVGESFILEKAKAGKVRQFRVKDTLPTDVNYQAKDLRVIEKHANGCRRLLPDYAIFSRRLDTIFCVTKGQVLMYGSGGSGTPSLLSPHVNSCTHIAVTDSGKVLVAEGTTVHIFYPLKSQSIGIGSSMLKTEVKLDSVTSIDQICCYGEEFAVLATKERKILIFSEKGPYKREFNVESVAVGSRMAVDMNGQIYLSGEVKMEEKTETGTLIGCTRSCLRPPPQKHSQLRVTMSTTIKLYSWKGQLVANLPLEKWTETFDYKFDKKCVGCGRARTRDDRSLDDRINNVSCKGLCVDGDEILSIAVNNQIGVYSRKSRPAVPGDDNEVVTAKESNEKTTNVERHMARGGGFEERSELTTGIRTQVVKRHNGRRRYNMSGGGLSQAAEPVPVTYSYGGYMSVGGYGEKPEPVTDVWGKAENVEKPTQVARVGRHMTTEKGFAGELGGISLMPDGRMIICEKGSNRIVIL